MVTVSGSVSWDTIGPFLMWQFLIPLVGARIRLRVRDESTVTDTT